MSDKQLAVREAAQIVGREEWDEPKRELLARTIAKGATSDELELFVAVCKRTGLDPFLRQIYFVKYGGAVSIQVSIDGYRVQAERSGKYAGQIGPQWCGPDGVWSDVWLEDGPPTAARVGVLRSDFAHPIWAVCRFKSYVKQTDFWRQMPDQMIGKCAESLAFRKAFPRELMGLEPRRTEEEAVLDEADPGPSPRAQAMVARWEATVAEADALQAPEEIAPEDIPFERVAEPEAGELPGPRWAPTPRGRQVSAMADTLLSLPENDTRRRFVLPSDKATDDELQQWLDAKQRLLNARAAAR